MGDAGAAFVFAALLVYAAADIDSVRSNMNATPVVKNTFFELSNICVHDRG